MNRTSIFLPIQLNIIIGFTLIENYYKYIDAILVQFKLNVNTHIIKQFRLMRGGNDWGQLNLEEVNEQLREQEKQLVKTIGHQNKLIEQLQAYLQMMEMNIADEIADMQTLNDKNTKCQQTIQGLQRQYQAQRQAELDWQKRWTIQYDKKQLAVTNSKEQLCRIKQQLNQKSKQLTGKTNQITQIFNHTKLMENRLDLLNSQNKKLQMEINRANAETKQMTDYIEQCYLNKKKLNNQLQELRGNIRVYCRIRPFLQNQDEEPTYQLLNENTLKLKVPKENHKSQNHQKDYIFNFQQIFDMKENQQNIFNQLAQLIQSSVDGKNVCIFAYGQTGSGKTYTMQGGEHSYSKGIIPRSIQLIFSQVQKAKIYQWESQISVTIQQVYLDTVKDLLIPKNSSDDLLSRFQVKNPIEVYSLLQQASKNRKVAETSCNQHSSRSHLIFTIHIASKCLEKNLERKGSLNLVDLAGSERVALSKVEGERMKQTQAINKSLTHLGVVISALAKKESHIPFRNSKLTFLLQKYLEGDSKTLMFVNISPKIGDFNQTMCSLRFAEKVKQCKIKK